LLLLAHLLTTIASLLGSGGTKTAVAESLLMKQQLRVVSRSRRRAPNLTTLDRFFLGFCSLLVWPGRIRKAAVTNRPSTLLGFPADLEHFLRYIGAAFGISSGDRDGLVVPLSRVAHGDHGLLVAASCDIDTDGDGIAPVLSWRLPGLRGLDPRAWDDLPAIVLKPHTSSYPIVTFLTFRHCLASKISALEITRMSLETLTLVGSVLILSLKIVCLVLGYLTIRLGYTLLLKGIQGEFKFKTKWPGINADLQSASPGLLFLLLGILLMAYAMMVEKGVTVTQNSVPAKGSEIRLSKKATS